MWGIRIYGEMNKNFKILLSENLHGLKNGCNFALAKRERRLTSEADPGKRTRTLTTMPQEEAASF